MQAVASWGLAVAAVVTGAAVFKVDSMARATFLLLASFLCVAGELLLLGGLGYLGVLVILMMTMEMVIMAIFMVMYMMNPAGLMPMTMVHNRRGAAAIAAAVFLALAAGVLLTPWPQRQGTAPPDPTYALGDALMGRSMLVMMLVGLAILATMISGVVLATTRGRYDREGEPADPRLGGQGAGYAPGPGHGHAPGPDHGHGHGAMPPEGGGR